MEQSRSVPPGVIVLIGFGLLLLAGLGLTLPMAAPQRYRGLLAMNTSLGTGDVPLSPGFLA